MLLNSWWLPHRLFASLTFLATFAYTPSDASNGIGSFLNAGPTAPQEPRFSFTDCYTRHRGARNTRGLQCNAPDTRSAVCKADLVASIRNCRIGRCRLNRLLTPREAHQSSLSSQRCASRDNFFPAICTYNKRRHALDTHRFIPLPTV